jgi:hypothetical protein
MTKFKTHFEQVPLETVRKIVREQIQREATNDDGINKEALEKGLATVEETIHGRRRKFSDGEV